MLTIHRPLRLVALIALAAAAAAVWAAIDRGGVARGVLANAALRNTSTIRVAGVDYDISQAQIFVDGVPGAGTDLKVGQVLDVTDIVYPEGWPDAGGLPTAGIVSFQDLVQGPISSIQSTGPGVGVLTVLGQQVTVDLSTVIDASLGGFDMLSIGDRLEISGYAGAPGEVLATRIDPAPAGPFELTGELRFVNNNVLLIGNQIVFIGIADLTDFGEDGPQVGDWAEVQGVLRGNFIVALTVERQTRGLTGEAMQEIELEGFITAVDSPSSFEVDGTPVVTNVDTEFDDGDPQDVAVGAFVEVEGELDEGGTIITARSVDFDVD